MFERFRTIFFVAGVLFFAVPFVFLILAPARQLSVLSVPAGTTPPTLTSQEKEGRHIYIREGCWYCHSQFVRPLDAEEFRYGPSSEAWEHLADLPHLYGTRRIGPDLAREGRKRSDDWHFLHLFDPVRVIPDSIMPAFPWLFANDPTRPTDEGKALVAYLQSLGKGKTSTVVASSDQLSAMGKTIYAANCLTCHGEKGDGRGPAAVALRPPPRNFLSDSFKYGDSPEAVFDTITRGIPGTSMPSFAAMNEDERRAVAHYTLHFRRGQP